MRPQRELSNGRGRERRSLSKGRLLKKWIWSCTKLRTPMTVTVQNQVPSALSFRQFPPHFTCIHSKLSQCQWSLRIQVITVLRKSNWQLRESKRFGVASPLGFNLFSLDTLIQQSIQCWFFFFFFILSFLFFLNHEAWIWMQFCSCCHRVYRMVAEGEMGCHIIRLLDLFQEKFLTQFSKCSRVSGPALFVLYNVPSVLTECGLMRMPSGVVSDLMVFFQSWSNKH